MARDRIDDEYDDRDDDRPRRRRGGGDRDRARSMVSGPAVGLIVAGVLSILGGLANVGYMASGLMDQQFAESRKQMDNDPNMDPQAKATAKQFLDSYEKAVKVWVPVAAGIAALTGLVTIIGGVKMRSLSGRGLAMTGSILAMIPCVGGCCLVGIPMGIWAIVTLGKPEVKAAFAASGGSPAYDDLDDRG